MKEYPDLVIDAWLETLKSGKSVAMTVGGRSMLPFFKENDIIEIHPVNDHCDIGIGSVILYEWRPRRHHGVMRHKKGHGLVTHRVIRVIKSYGEPLFLTRGDFNSCFDRPVFFRDVLGIVTRLKRGSRVINTLSIHQRTIGLMFSLIGYFAGLLFRNYRRRI